MRITNPADMSSTVQAALAELQTKVSTLRDTFDDRLRVRTRSARAQQGVKIDALREEHRKQLQDLEREQAATLSYKTGNAEANAKRLQISLREARDERDMFKQSAVTRKQLLEEDESAAAGLEEQLRLFAGESVSQRL